jgi:transcriptional regulator GlxA family with amidase domain
MRQISKLDVARYVHECARRETPPRVSELAQMHAVSVGHISRVFRRRFGMSLSDYMKAVQVRTAERLLRNTKLDMNRIAYGCGFGTRRTFYRTYRRLTGHSPQQYRLLTRRAPRRTWHEASGGIASRS